MLRRVDYETYIYSKDKIQLDYYFSWFRDYIYTYSVYIYAYIFLTQL